MLFQNDQILALTTDRMNCRIRVYFGYLILVVLLLLPLIDRHVLLCFGEARIFLPLAFLLVTLVIQIGNVPHVFLLVITPAHAPLQHALIPKLVPMVPNAPTADVIPPPT